MKIEMIDCKEVIHHICDSLGEDLDSPRCIEIKSHIQKCNGCKSYLNSMEQVISYYKNYNIPLSEEVHQKLMEKLGLTDC